MQNLKNGRLHKLLIEVAAWTRTVEGGVNLTWLPTLFAARKKQTVTA